MANNFCLTCPTDCNIDLPIVDCAKCITVLNGQVAKLFIGKVGNPLTAIGDLVTRLDNTTVADDTKIRVIGVKGQLSAPESTKLELELNIDYYPVKNYSLTATSSNLSDNNYEFNRTMQSCQGKVLVWYTMLDEKHIYGGLTGIEANINPVTGSTGDGRTDTLNTTYELSWTAECDPIRLANPVAGILC